MGASTTSGLTIASPRSRSRTPSMTARTRDGRSGCRAPPSCSVAPDGPATTSAVTPSLSSMSTVQTGHPLRPCYGRRIEAAGTRRPTLKAMCAARMQAWAVERPGPVDGGPLDRVERDVPEPAVGQVRVRVRVCGVCRTDLHVAEGDLPPHRPGVTPGHEVIGTVDQLGERRSALAGRRPHRDPVARPHLRRVRLLHHGSREPVHGAALHRLGRRRGLRRVRRWSRRRTPTPCPMSSATRRPHPCSARGSSATAALQRANLPEGGRLGIYGFGGSAHITAQVALARGARVHVMTRSAEAQALALALGAASAGGADARPPEPLDSAILFAPVGTLVPTALAALDRGGTLAIAGIHLSDVPPLDYQAHLFEERTLQSVTANTRHDGEAFLAEAARIPVRVTTTPYPMARAADALKDLAHDRVNGAAVPDGLRSQTPTATGNSGERENADGAPVD